MINKPNKISNICHFAFLAFLVFTGCNSNSNKIVETENETAKCMIGKWSKEIKDQSLVTYEFTPDFHFTAEGFDSKGVSHQIRGNWTIKDVGYIRAVSGSRVFRFKLTNCDRLVLKGRTVYIKE